MQDDPATRDAKRAIEGDSEALDRLWQRHRRWAAAVALAYMPRDAELDDLLQEIAMNVVRKIKDLRDPAMFRPWLRQITINAARTSARRRSVRSRMMKIKQAEAATNAPARSASDQGSDRVQGRRLLELAHRLHPDYREPLLLRCVHGMTYRQMAGVLDLPVTTIETRIARARRMLREEVEFEEDASKMRVVQRASVGQ